MSLISCRVDRNSHQNWIYFITFSSVPRRRGFVTLGEILRKSFSSHSERYRAIIDVTIGTRKLEFLKTSSLLGTQFFVLFSDESVKDEIKGSFHAITRVVWLWTVLKQLLPFSTFEQGLFCQRLSKQIRIEEFLDQTGLFVGFVTWKCLEINIHALFLIVHFQIIWFKLLKIYGQFKTALKIFSDKIFIPFPQKSNKRLVILSNVKVIVTNQSSILRCRTETDVRKHQNSHDACTSITSGSSSTKNRNSQMFDASSRCRAKKNVWKKFHKIVCRTNELVQWMEANVAELAKMMENLFFFLSSWKFLFVFSSSHV